jgi:hypothetical protein
MLTIIDGRVPAAEPVSPAPALDEPTCIFAALIDGLTSQERYSLEVRNGELYIAPTRRRDGPQANVVPTNRAA